MEIKVEIKKETKLIDGKKKSNRGPKVKFPDLKCPECQKEFSRSKDIGQHIRRVHKSEKNFECKRCPKTFMNLWELKNHKPVHKSIEKREKFQCEECYEVFLRKANLSRHIGICVNGQRFECNMCDATFTRKDTLKTHMEGPVHGGERGNKQCAVCRRRFQSMAHLSDHMRAQHFMESEFKCCICVDTFFPRKEYLTKHMKNFHSDFVMQGIRLHRIKKYNKKSL